ncbi:alkene reductase [Nocardia crassostreae]|uniref:alkene reductase n=1 Tax=Nocardia crassostreae TaxID=53428 RepID=UPI00082C3CE6|nr:alkene reductase [Nocardia crassostreae]
MSQPETDALFDPIAVGTLDLPNRLVMAPMTRSRAQDGLVGESTAEYYAQRAGSGLIVTEGIQPGVLGQGYIQTPGLHNAEQVAAWRKVTDAVHAAGGRIFAQLMHTGRVGHPVLYPNGELPLAPSSIASGGQLFTPEGMLEHPVPRAITRDDIADVVREHIDAARNAVDAGFDGVELHGANGYLIHQFLADGSNARTDEYGGAAGDRIRFAVEVVTAVADAIGAERTGLRISPAVTLNGITESDSAELYPALLRALAALPLAYVHVMEMGTRELTLLVRAAWPGTLILNPHPVYPSVPATPEPGAQALAAGIADAVSLGSYWLANPDLPTRIRVGGPYNTADRATFYGGDDRGYTDYPTLPQP